MFWQDDDGKNSITVPDDIVDVAFKIECKTLPIDHAQELYDQLSGTCPWLEQDPDIGIHTIHVAESGNGWTRPENADDILCLSKRTKFTLRVPKQRIDQALALDGAELDIAGHALTIRQGSVKLLSPISTIFSRYVICNEGDSEDEFLQNVVNDFQQRGVRVRKLLCGKSHRIGVADQVLFARTLMLADLDIADSILLQQQGVGTYQKLGCGLFIPHKGISAIREEQA